MNKSELFQTAVTADVRQHTGESARRLKYVLKSKEKMKPGLKSKQVIRQPWGNTTIHFQDYSGSLPKLPQTPKFFGLWKLLGKTLLWSFITPYLDPQLFRLPPSTRLTSPYLQSLPRSGSWPHPENGAREFVKVTEYTGLTKEGEREAKGADIKLKQLFDRADPRNKFEL